MTTVSFHLTTEPWVQCQSIDGTPAFLSLRDIFDGEHPVVALRGNSPTQDYALLRVLLAIFLRAHRAALGLTAADTFDFEDWVEEQWERLDRGEADNAVLRYLDEHTDRFDLLHPSQPFMQVADLHTANDSRLEISRIVPEAEKSYFTMRSGAARESLEFAEAARWLIHTHAYDCSGIKPGAVGDPRVSNNKGYPIGQGWAGLSGGTTILGATLRETLVLNVTADDLLGSDRDLPVWEREPDGPAQRPSVEPAGTADIYTWQSRRIRLFHDDKRVTAVLVSNGDRIPKGGANILFDPMTPYRFSTKQSTKQSQVFYPRPYDTSRMMWKGLEPLICLDGDHPDAGPLALAKGEHAPKRPRTLTQVAELHRDHYADERRVLNVRLTSMSYGVKASSVATVMDARVDIPRALLHPDNVQARQTVLTAARVTLNAAIHLGQFGGDLQRAAGGEYAFRPDPTDGLLSELEPEFRDWLRKLTVETTDGDARTWQHIVRTAVIDRAHELLRGAGPNALIGREVTENDRTVTHSAGTAYARLEQQLRHTLHLTAPTSSPPVPNTLSSGSDEPKETPDAS